MKRSTCRTALVTLALALAVSVSAASAASAAPEWYSSATPATAEWQQGGKALGETTATVWKGHVRIADLTLVNATVECEATGTGTVGPGGAGQDTSWTLSGCTLVKAGNCTKLENIKAVNVPWNTELGYSRGVARDALSNGESQIGFQLTCTVYGIKIPDKCTARKLYTTSENGASGVNTSFSEAVTCNLGSEKDAGRVEGNESVEASTGGKLEVAGKEGPFTKVASSLAVDSTGKLTIEDQGWGDTRVSCTVQTTGGIEPAGKGTITSYFVSGCTASGSLCSSLDTVTAVNLPWKTALSEAGGVISESILSGGSGTPQWHFECTGGGVRREDTCNLNVSPAMHNGPSGNVDALFYGNRVSCARDSKENEGLWEGELAVEHPASVAEIAVK